MIFSLFTPQRFIFMTQFLSFMAAVAFSAGGGNYAGLIPRSFIYIKAMLLLYPILGLGFILLRRKSTSSHIILLLKDNIFYCLYLVVGLISVIFSFDPTYSFNRIIYTNAGFLCLISIVMQFNYCSDVSDKLKFLLSVINVLTFFSILYSCYIVFNKTIVSFIPGFRFALQSDLLIHPNLLASFYAHLFIWHFFFCFHGRNKMLHALYSFILLSLIILLFSRTVFFSLFLGALAYPFILFCLYKRSKNLLQFFLSIIFALSIAVLILLNILPVKSLLTLISRQSPIESLFTLTNRSKLWVDLFSQLDLKIFFIGNGYAIMTKNFGVNFGTGILYGSHNAYFSIFFGCGVFGLTSTVIFFLLKIKNLVSRYKHLPFLPIVLSSCFLFFINCMTAEEMGINTSITFAYVFFLAHVLNPVSQEGI